MQSGRSGSLFYTLTVQNSVPKSDLGTATSTSIFARQVGGSLGLAVFGSIFSARLTQGLASRLPPAVLGTLLGPNDLAPEAIARLAPDVRLEVLASYGQATSTVFLVATLALGIGLVLLLPPVPLREGGSGGGP